MRANLISHKFHHPPIDFLVTYILMINSLAFEHHLELNYVATVIGG